VTQPTDLPPTALALADVARAQRAFLARVASLDESSARADSALEGWSRADVVAHLVVLAHAFIRQCEHAARGEVVDVYVGGHAGRNAAIELLADQEWPVIATEAESALAALDAAWPADAEGWERPVQYRSGVLHEILLSWWREVCIHIADVNLGDVPEAWSPGLARHLCDFLASRLPDGEWVTLRASDDDSVLSTGAVEGDELVVTGALVDLATWLAGREPAGELWAEVGGVGCLLPELGPWPLARLDSASD
jgi:maleylpyruvate isomerase